MSRTNERYIIWTIVWQVISIKLLKSHTMKRLYEPHEILHRLLVSKIETRLIFDDGPTSTDAMLVNLYNSLTL